MCAANSYVLKTNSLSFNSSCTFLLSEKNCITKATAVINIISNYFLFCKP